MEYLISYGWAIVLVITVASVLFFVFSPLPNEKIDFSLQDSNRVLFKSGNLASGGGANKCEIVLQNANSDSINVFGVSSTVSENDRDIAVNGLLPRIAAPVVVKEGEQIRITNIDAPTSGEVSGNVVLSYSDKEKNSRIAIIRVSGKIRTSKK
jgi:hypothetical protein